MVLDQVRASRAAQILEERARDREEVAWSPL